ncbi:e3 ubiquitin-protein ligase ubr3 [Willisornis vidua]|uniref:E3 ubiquitin-protein ligase n=1 Tax=Willisornis vidua TaxID=1566151 RepID=A0ABQ9DAF3_9PASS|nr:e3 ubiquitin-protein ligase ubr3 [Willisornis vidua]
MAGAGSRDKRATAARLKAALGGESGAAAAAELRALLERVLAPTAGPGGGEAAGEALEWCRCLLSGGEPWDSFVQAVRAYDPATLCGLVWTANFVAYRCRTCGISPCMSLCAECFHQGEHAGHDYNMFRSQAGGACDCGDSNVMREAGFCKRHRIKSNSNVPCVPKDLLMMSELVLPQFIFSLIQHLREGYNEPALDLPSEKDLHKILQVLEPHVSFLEDLTKMGGAMRSVLTQVLTSQQFYKDLSSGVGENACTKKSHEKYLIALKGSGLAFPEDKIACGLQEQGAGTSTLAVQGLAGATAASGQGDSSDEEDQDGSQGVGKRKRVKLSSTTKDQSIMDVLKHKCFLEELLFWTIKYEFPQKMVTFLLNMLPDQDYKIAFTKTFVQHYAFIMKTLKKSHESDTMSNRIVHISVQLFSNEELARQVTEECQLLDIMVTVLLYMMESCLIKSELQGMNLNKRELNEHVEFESQTYYAAFAAELEACAQPMWGLLSHCKVRETQEYTRNVVRYCLEALQDWFDAINFVDEAVKCQELDLDTILPDQEMLMKLMIHPLQIQASLSEIHSNMWVRNGLQIKGQAMTYVQSHFCNSMIDPDIYLLQRHYIPENPNPKSGIIPGSLSFESVLSAVADFKAPVFEPGGSMQQGMYTPKAEVWDKEFDPVMVILRTVYRRDVQSAMDRYTAFLKQSGKFPGNPWPPYKKRTPLHPSYKGLIKLLHCKTLHIVLFTLLYKILMDHQNLSEHVLCMVLYLIELGLENSPEQESDEEESACGQERCHDSWFPGSNLVSNMRHFINYVRVRVPETAPEVKREPPASTSSDGLALPQNSGTAQVFSLVAERRKKFQEIINRNTSEANQVVRPKTSMKWSAPGATPQLTTAILEVKESILSLLIKLHHKLSGKQNSYYPPWLDDVDVLIHPEVPRYSHGDGMTAVERILLKAAVQSRLNKRIIEEICRKVTPPVPPKKISSAEKKTLDKEERRQKARERQQKLLAEFASRQKSFMETAMDVESPDADMAMEVATSEQHVSEAIYDCVICGQSGPSTEDRPTGLVVLLQASSVLGQCRNSPEPKRLPTTEEEQIYPWDTCAALHDVRLSTLQRYFKDSSCLQAVSIGWEGGVYVQTCGHTLHIDCHKSYMESLRNDQVLQGFSVDKGEFTCPLCRQFANSVLPCYPGNNVERSVWQSHSNKCMQDLVQEVEDLQEQLGTFPSETNLSKEMESVMKDIKSTTQKKYTDYSKSPGSPDNDFLFMYSVARLVSEELPEVPVLYRDVSSLLLIQILTMPQPLHKEHFTCIVKVLFTLLYTQALAALSVKCSTEDRMAWKEAGALKKVNPDSVERDLQQFCLPFLRITSLLQHHLFGADLPGCQHSQNCGAGTGIFLLINASVIIIIRGHRFCLWGSVYLDAHGEEDRDLRRGKPLYICKERYKVLEQQWVSHTFDHINKRWGPHYNGL